MPARMEFEFGLGGDESRRTRARADEMPMRLLVMGDFSACTPEQRPPLAERPTHRVDHDSLDGVMRRLAPRLSLPGADLRFEEIEHFHPDALYQRLALFAALRRARAEPPTAGTDLLGSLLGGVKAAAPAPPAPAKSGVDAFIHGIVAPHIVADKSSQRASMTAAVDAATAEQMRKLLHDPSFQALEAAWRGVHWLISGLELDERLQLHLLDVTRDELLADVVAASGQAAQTGLQRALAARGEDWSALVGLYRFGASDADVGLLAALGLIAAQAGAPLLAEGDPALASEPVGAGWQVLRRSEAAPWIGLAAPRVLLRLPYGTGSEPIGAFAFEEFAGTPAHESFLWGAPALALGLLIARAYSARGWQFEPGDEREIADLPAYVVMRDGEKHLQPCNEAVLDEQAAQALLNAGLMPLLAHRNRNALTVMRFQSVAEPSAALAGAWQKA